MSRDKTLLQAAMIKFVESCHADRSADSPAEFERIRKAIDELGQWQEFSEWRISTHFDSSIAKLDVKGQSWFKVRVECDGQEFICRCPTLEKAVLLRRFYERLIIDQFYSVGPPWA